ncbi:MAG TPA: T9SS type A sorting domain-containing protein [Saprospiraceae bacterium]|nr:T9SS type A sorting domain-containing protein [Saprospiraceae bacterium]
MKPFFTLFFVVVSMTLGLAQTFSVSLLSDQVPLDGTNGMEIDLEVSNLTSDTIFIAWERTEVRMPEGWTSYICDPLFCLGPNVSSKVFSLVGNSSGTFSMHVNPTNVDYAILSIKFYDKKHPNDSIIGEYTFGQVTATDDLAVAPIEIYPNPATSFFQIENGEKVDLIEVFDLLGVKVLQSTPQRYVDVTTLKPGLYFVRLSDRNGKVLTTQRLHKN